MGGKVTVYIMVYFICIATALVAYFIGSINTSIILSKKFTGEDIRNSGSGNAGTTNMLRTYGKKLALVTLICDILKGVVPVLLAVLADKFILSGLSSTSAPASYLLGSLNYIAGFFAILGHSFPVFFGFKGGKGVATGFGVVLALNWQVGLIALAVAVIIMAFTRYVSLGSIIGAALFPILLLAFSFGSGEVDIMSMVFAFAIAALIIVRHRTNIKRLLNGNENKLFIKKN